jgi:hypothetical protein
MALVIADRVKETTTTTGAGTLNLAGAGTGFRTFVAGIGNGNVCPYIIDNGLGEWETGLGTVTDATPDTLARTVILASSNAGAAVNFSAGTKTVACVPIASGAMRLWNTGLMVADTDTSHFLTIKPGSNLTADRVLTITTGDVDRTLTVTATVTFLADFSYNSSTGALTDASGAGLVITTNRYTLKTLGAGTMFQASVSYPVTASGAAAQLTGFDTMPANGGIVCNVWQASDGIPYLGFITGGSAGMVFKNASTGAAITNATLSNKTLIISGIYTTA